MKWFKLFIVYTLFYLGDFVSRSFNWRFWELVNNKLFDLLFTTLFEMYNFFMISSIELQDKWNLDKPWTRVENDSNS